MAEPRCWLNDQANSFNFETKEKKVKRSQGVTNDESEMISEYMPPALQQNNSYMHYI